MNVGLVGAHRGNSLIRCMSRFDGVRIAAVCDLDGARAAETAKSVGDGSAKVFTDYQALLADSVDAVVIATPPSCHVPMAVAALGKGKHVISEVPAVDSIDEARSLFEAARDARGSYMMAENTNFWPAVEHARRLAGGGKLGEFYHMEAEYLHDCRSLWSDPAGKPTWRRSYHPVKYCSHSLGPLLEVSGRRVVSAVCLHSGVPNRHFEGAPIPDSYTALYRLDNGGTAVVRTDFSTPRPGGRSEHRFFFQGTKGCVDIPMGHGAAGRCFFHEAERDWVDLAKADPACASGDAGEKLPDWAAAGGHGTAEYFMLKDFLDAVGDRRPPRIDVRMALATSVPGQCALLSAQRGGEPVDVPDFR